MRKINERDLYFRKLALESSKDEIIEKNCKLYLESSLSSVSGAIRFVKECAKDSTMATRYLNRMIYQINNLRDNDSITRIFESQVLPIVKNGYEKIDVESLHTSYDNKNLIREQIMINKNCDRILGNHDHIIKEFNLLEYADKCQDIDMVVEKCCSIVDKFDLPLFGKINIAIEESLYDLTSKNEPSSIDKDRVLETAVKYFSIRNHIYSNDISKINTTLRDNKMMVYNEASISEETSPVDLFIFAPEKNDTLLDSTIESILSKPTYELADNLHELFYLFLMTIVSSEDQQLITYIIEKSVPSIYDIFYKNKLSSVDLSVSVAIMNKAIHIASDKAIEYTKMYPDATVQSNMNSYTNALAELQEKFSNLSDIAYTEYDMNQMNPVATTHESKDIITLEDFKQYKFNNLINAASSIDAIIRDKMTNTREKAKENFKKIRNKLWGIKETSVYDCLDEDGNIDLIVSTYKAPSDKVTAYIQQEASDICKDINESHKFEDYRCYYLATETTIEFHIRETDNSIVSLTEQEKIEQSSYITPENREALTELFELTDHDIMVNEEDILNRLTEDNFSTFVEVAKYARFEKEFISEAYHNLVKQYGAMFAIKEYHVMDSYEKENYPKEIQLEALDIMAVMLEKDDADESVKDKVVNKIKDLREKDKAVAEKIKGNVKSGVEDLQKQKESLNEAKVDPKDQKNNNKDKNQKPVVNKNQKDNKKPVSDKDDKKKDSKEDDKFNEKENEEEKKKFDITLNDVQLFLAGLKKKGKDLSAKEKSVSNDIDVATRNLANAVKSMFVSDRREDIIKGRVIPSFSKCVKLAIGIAGSSALTGPYFPLTAALEIIGAVIVSKNLTKKERALLLDDIEIELQMVDKEMQLAESKNQMKKLRALMKTKKQLQRQYQRIKFNTRVGKDLLPGDSSIGTPGNDND